MAQITLKNRALFINHLLFFLKESTQPLACALQAVVSHLHLARLLPFQFSSAEFVARGAGSLLFPGRQHPASLASGRSGQDGAAGRILAALNDGLGWCFFDCGVFILGFLFLFSTTFRSAPCCLPAWLREGGGVQVSAPGGTQTSAAALPSAGLAAGHRHPPRPSGGLWPNPASRNLWDMPGTCSTMSHIACGPGWALLSQQLGQQARWQQGAGPWGRGTTRQGGSVPHRDCHEQAWAAQAAGTPEDSNLSQTCVLIPVQPIYIHNSCYFFPSYMDASCPRSPLPSPSKPCCFSHACPGRRGASSPWGRARCSLGRHVGAALPPAAPRPRRPLPPAPGQEPRRTQPGLCEHGVCFARVTCLIISFSGGRLVLVSTVTAPLRGEAIRQRVKQVIKTLKPCAHWEGGRASRTQRDETGRAREAAGAPEPVRRGDTRLASQPRQGTGCQRAPAASRHAALVRCHLGRRCCRQRAALAGPALLAPS